ncbi:MAG: type 4a pilus biogenesis protein PilO [Candidatus Paceibacterota bacterium]
MKESGKRLISLMLAVVLLLLSLYIFGSFVKPVFSEISQLRAELTASRNYLKAQEEAKASFNNLFTDYKNASSIQNLLALALPNKEEVADAVYQIQALAGMNNITLMNIEVEEGQGEAVSAKSLIREVGKMKINFRASGNYFNFKSFVAGLENNIKLMDVTSVEADSTKEPGGNLTYNMVVETYYQK